MTENVYKVVELVGTSTESWEKATAAAISRASKTLRDLRVAEVEAYRSRISVSFKYESKN
jgi:flavin-binding protein dodecin